MALRPGKPMKEVKKASYYVWFLGAKESNGLRGDEHMRPAVRHLIDREMDVEPLKVTLQVSGKGLKIIQNETSLSTRTSSSSSSKAKVQETTKHFIPDHSITCVTQENVPDDDVVACILLIYNPVSKCPVHVHAYRCDSVDTATVLRQHLQQLIDRPENQRKFAELEIRLQAKGLIAPNSNFGGGDGATTKKPCNSDGQSIRTESDSSGGSSEKDIYALDDRMSNLYDSLAAELREKLNNKKNNGPILLPPRDYDSTANKLRGKLPEVETSHRGALATTSSSKPATANPTSDLKKSSKLEVGGRTPTGYVEEQNSSGKSSGIGSDEAPSSPTHEREISGGGGVGHNGRHSRRTEPIAREPIVRPEYESSPARRKNVDTQNTSSDEEWEANRDPQAKTERDMMLVQSPTTARRPLSGGIRSFPYDGRHHSRERRDLSPPSHDIPPIVQAPATHRERFYDRDDEYNHNRTHPVPVTEMPRRGGANEAVITAKKDVSERCHRPEQKYDRQLDPRSVHRQHESSQHQPVSPDHSYDDQVHRREPSASRSRGDRGERRQVPSSWEIEMSEGPGLFHGSRDLASRRSSPSTPTTNSSYHPQLVGSKSFDDKRHLQKTTDEDSLQYRRHHRDNDLHDRHYPADSYHHRDERSSDPRRVSSPPVLTRSQPSTMPSLIGPPVPSQGTDYRGTPAVFRDAYVPLPRIKRIDSGGHSSSNVANHHPPSSKASHHHHDVDRSSHQSRGYYQELPEEKRFPGLDRSTARLHHHLLLNGGTTAIGHSGSANGSSTNGGGQRYSSATPSSHPSINRGEQHHERVPDLRHSSREREWEDSRPHHQRSSPSKRVTEIEERGNRHAAPYSGGGGFSTASAHLPPPHYPSAARRSPDHFRPDVPANNCHAAPGRQQPPQSAGLRQELVRRYAAEDDDAPARGAEVDRRFYRYSGSADPDPRHQPHRINASSGYRHGNY